MAYGAWAGPVAQCSYYGIQPGGKEAELQEFPNCGTIDGDGIFHVNRELLKLLHFDHNKPACVSTGMSGFKYFYVTRAGKAVETLQNYTDDPDCDEFHDGLARSPSPAGTRFVDHSLKAVISTPYEYAFRFEGAFALVCNDLRRFTPFYDEDGIGEYVGGHCGYINRRGALVVPLGPAYGEAYAHAPSSATPDAAAGEQSKLRGLELGEKR